MILLLLLSLSAAPAAAGFDGWFTGDTLRVDLYHSGTAAEERIALGRLRIEGPWPGSRTRLLDETGLGKYRVEVVALPSNRVIYSRGFASIYGEWETTGEANQGVWNTIEEAVRIPEPKARFQLRLMKRASDQTFAQLWTRTIDPASRFVDRSPVPPADVVEIEVHGDPATKVDLLILGDGYAADRRDKFLADARKARDALFAVDPFKKRRKDFNTRAIWTPSPEQGVARPRAGVYRETPLGARYNTFDSERYVLSLEDKRWRDVAAAAPYDTVLILVDERKYGGGGIFNLYATAAADSAYADYLVVHEFGHSFAGLGDEYYSSSVAYEKFTAPDVEPWEPNITALLDPEKLKWADLVDGTPLPTPWGKEAYDAESRAYQERRNAMRAEGASEAEMEALFDEVKKESTATLAAEKHAGKVGAFEGAMYESRGLYRPRADCIMFTRNDVGFCPVCSRAIEQVIDLLSR
ncbi:hypothetical protein ABI59_08670 [Acidobacteria bacterium Mor1]|nr:hypothetical protein ABI59_08670 [Acidobacteria bacterium Mor1]